MKILFFAPFEYSRFSSGLFLSLLLLLLVRATPSSSTCYFPNGDTTADTPCGPQSSNSTCCGPGYACLSNHICALTSFVSASIAVSSSFYVRGSCTDRSWTSPECPLFCLNATNGDNLGVGGMGVGKCDGNGSLDRYYCRNEKTAGISDGVLCADEKWSFGFDGGFPSTVTVIGVDPTSTTASSTLRPASSSTSHAASASQGAITPASNTSTTPPIAQEKHKSRNSALGAGLGVGFGIPLVLSLGVIACLLRRNRRHTRHIAELDSQNTRENNGAEPVVYEAPTTPMRQTHELSAKDSVAKPAVREYRSELTE